MSDAVLQSQSLQQETVFRVGQSVDLTSPPVSSYTSSPLTNDKTIISPNNSAAFSSYVEFSLPYSLISELSLNISVGAATTTNWAAYPAFGALGLVQIRSGSNILTEYNWPTVMRHILTSAPGPSFVSSILGSMGPSTAASAAWTGTVLIPTPWSRFAKNLDESTYAQPLAANLVDQKLVLRVYVNPSSNMLVSGGAYTTNTISLSLNVYTVAATAARLNEMKALAAASGYRYKSLDYQTFTANSALATATTATADFSGVYGSIVAIELQPVLDSNDTANAEYVMTNTISDIIVKIDGRQYYQSEASNYRSLQLEALLNGCVTDATCGRPTVISMDVLPVHSSYSGALNSGIFTKLNVQYQHANGAATTVYGLGIVNCFIQYQNGSFIRIN